MDPWAGITYISSVHLLGNSLLETYVQSFQGPTDMMIMHLALDGIVKLAIALCLGLRTVAVTFET